MSGYIKLYRGWHDSEQFSQESYCERAAWCWLLTNAAWKETTQRNHKGEVIIVNRGQYHTSIRCLAGQWRWSNKRVRTFLKVLEKCGSAGTASAQSGTLITLWKYEDYQSGGHTLGTEGGTDGYTDGAQTGHTKEEDKKKEEINDRADKPAHAFTFDDFVETWNEVAGECGLASIKRKTTSRRRAFACRQKEYPDIDDWKAAFRCLQLNKWMHGDNKNGWRADPDFFLQAKSFTKLVENQYGKADR
jgi:hypothetical protein